MINSIQQITVTIGSGSTSGTTTITSVSTTLSALMWNGLTGTATTNTQDKNWCTCVLTNATTVTATRNTSEATTLTVRCTVVEYTASFVKSVQTGTITIANGQTTNTATITGVNLGNAVCIWNGSTSTFTTQDYGKGQGAVSLTNNNTVTATRGSSDTATVTIAYTILEFQYGVITSRQVSLVTVASNATSGTGTVTAVTTANSMCFWGGFTSDSTSAETNLPRVTLTNTTTLTATRGGAIVGVTCTAYITLIEFNSSYLQSTTRAETTIAGSGTTGTAVLAIVATTDSFMNWLGFTTTAAATNTDTCFCDAAITTTILATFTRQTASASARIVSWEVIEFSSTAYISKPYQPYFSRHIGGN